MFPWRVRVLLAVIALGSAIGLSATLAGQSGASSSKNDIEWRFFGGDAGATRYSSANQITAANVRDLRVAWRWSARNFGPRPASYDAGQSPDRRWRDVHDGEHQSRCRGTRCRHRPIAVALAPDRRVAAMVRHHRSARENLRPRRQLLDGRRGRRADLCRHEQLHARRARREDRATGVELRQGRCRRSGREPALERAAWIASRRPGVQHVSRGHRRQRPGGADFDAYRVDAEPSQRVHQRTVADEHPG